MKHPSFSPRNPTLALLASLCLASPAFALKIAIVSDAGAAVSPIVDLAQAQISESKGTGIQFVERAAIRKILEEQKLTLSGAVEAAQAIKVGKLLGTDLIAVVETDEDHAAATGILVFDARTGERLSDAALTGADERTAAAMSAALKIASQKVAVPVGKRRPICVMTVRNVDLPKTEEAFCLAVARLMERKLIASPDLVMLERDHLNELRKEQALAPTGEKNDLIASVIMLELQVARNESGGVHATCVLSDNHGNKVADPAHAIVKRREAEELAAGLSGEIVKSLKAATAPVTDVAAARAAEAQRFYREARFWWAHRDYDRPVTSMEAAAALDPENGLLQAELASSLIRAAVVRLAGALPDYQNPTLDIRGNLKPAEFSDSLALARAGLERLILIAPRPFTGESNRAANDSAKLLGQYLTAIAKLQEPRPARQASRNAAPLATEDLLDAFHGLRQDYWTFQRLRSNAPAPQDANDWKSASRATAHLQQVLMNPDFYTTATRAEVLDDLHTRIAAWKDMFNRNPPTGSPAVRGIAQLLEQKPLTAALTQTPSPLGPANRLSVSEHEKILAIYHLLAQVNDPACTAAAEAGKTWVTKSLPTERSRPKPDPLYPQPTRVPALLKPASGGTPIAPIATTAPANPWKNRTLILDVSEKQDGQVRSLSTPFPYQDNVYFLLNKRTPVAGELQQALVRINPAQPPAEKPAEPFGIPITRTILRAADVFHDSLVGGYYVSIDQRGEPVLFPLDGKEPIRLDAGRGFEFRCRNLTILKRKVYCSATGGIFIEYDLDTRAAKTLSASKRIDVQSPFDNQSPFGAAFLVPDPARDRVLFYAMGMNWPNDLAGLWEYNTKTARFKQILKHADNPGLGTGNLIGDDIIYRRNILHLATDEFQPSRSLTILRGRYTIDTTSPVAITEHFIWTTWGRAGLPDGPVEEFPEFNPEEIPFRQTRGYFPLDESRILTYAKQKIWILTPPDQPLTSGLTKSRKKALPPPITPPEGGELPWSKVTTLYDHFRDVQPIDNYTCPRLVGDNLFVLATGHAQLKDLRPSSGSYEDMHWGFGQLLSFPRDGSAPKPLAKIAVHSVPDKVDPEDRYTLGSSPAVVAVDDRYYYAAMKGENCIVVFPLDGSPARKIPVQNSLKHLAVLNGQLYAGWDNSFINDAVSLVKIDPVTGKAETLIKSTRTTDARGTHNFPFIKGLWPDPKNNRLLYLAHGTAPEPAGLFEWNPSTNKSRLLVPLLLTTYNAERLGAFGIYWTGANPDGSPLIYTRRGIITFDPATDKMTVIAHHHPMLDPLATKPLDPDAPPNKPPANDLLAGRIRTEAPIAIHNGFLWFANGRASLDGKRCEQFPPLRGGPPHRPKEFLFLPGGKQLLISDLYGAWILDLR